MYRMYINIVVKKYTILHKVKLSNFNETNFLFFTLEQNSSNFGVLAQYGKKICMLLLTVHLNAKL